MATYPWKRFWCSRSGSYRLDDLGFVADPEDEFWRYLNIDLRRFSDLVQTPCLGLLGEPGIGKSIAVEAAFADTRAAGAQALAVDLGGAASDEWVRRRILDTDVFRAWTDGDHELHLFLDSLDEAIASVRTIAKTLVYELENFDLSRLRLRIACRTAEWPHSLDERLPALFGATNTGVYELVPLRRADIAVAAQTEGVNAEAFIREAVDREVVALAIKPITLRFLLGMYRRSGTLPEAQNELYRDGLVLLAEEPDEDRRRLEMGNALSGPERLAVAERIAAVMIFAGRESVWIAADSSERSTTSITLADLSGGAEETASDLVAIPSPVEVGELELRDTINTGLFSARGSDAYGFAHRTYAEYLAARYLARHEVATEKALSLVTAADDAEHKVVPQLHEPTAWLATLRPDVFAALLERDPAVLLRSDGAVGDDAQRRQLVDFLLSLARKRTLGQGQLREARKLRHATLAEQLRPHLVSNESEQVRMAAIDIAEACAEITLVDDLFMLAGDEREPYRVRVNAAAACARIADNEGKLKLEPLLRLPAEQDPSDELKGVALRALWPDLVPIEELLAAITPPRDPDLIGAYVAFLASGRPMKLDDGLLAKALVWVAAQAGRVRQRRIADFVDDVILAGWERFDRRPAVATALAQACAALIRREYGLFRGRNANDYRAKLHEDNVRRRKLIVVVVGEILAGRLNVNDLAIVHERILTSDDVPFLLERLVRSSSDRERRVWARLTRSVYYLHHPDVELVLEAREVHQELADELWMYFDPVPVPSDLADDMREQHEQRKRWAVDVDADVRPPVADRVAALLEHSEAGDIEAWWSLSAELARDKHRPQYFDDTEADVRLTAVWRDADEPLRNRIIEAAVRFLELFDPKADSWFESGHCTNAVVGGYRALRLLLEEAPDHLRSLNEEVWQRWTAAILAWSSVPAAGNELPQYHELVRLAYERASDEFVRRLGQRIDLQAAASSDPWIVRSLGDLWNEDIAALIVARIVDGTYDVRARIVLLRFLVERAPARGIEVAKTLVPDAPPTCGGEREVAITAAALLIAGDGASFDRVFKSFRSSEDYGRLVVHRLAHVERVGNPVAELAEDDLMRLFRYLEERWPYSGDVRARGIRASTTRDEIERLRDSTLAGLEARGTPRSCQLLRELAEEREDLWWLAAMVVRGEAQLRRASWTPPTPAQLIELVARVDARFVADEDALADLVIESLGRLEAYLSGPNSAMVEVWNEIKQETRKSRFQPKSEVELSDRIARWFRSDLQARDLVVNREVEVTRSPGAPMGDRTDLLVEALAKGQSSDAVRVVVEVKGCWNRELKTALENQLVQQYLEPTGYRGGVYVVGRFASNAWDPADKARLAGCRKNESVEAADFACQAAELSGRHGLVLRSRVLDLTLNG